MMRSGGRRWPAGIKEQSLALAGRIRAITDLGKRTRVARAACLEAVKTHSAFPEILFLKECGVQIDDRQGPALRVKMTKHAIRFQEPSEAVWGTTHRTKERKALYRQAMGRASRNDETYLGEGDTGQYVCRHASMTGELQPVYLWQNRMW